ncbi:MAG: hypothetical protein COA78_38765 [Blastopirellula sp.]|nr:MAG: hypothetical protein COA78_38765 [Blastopirellula sp.]
MKLASLKSGRDGALVVVSRDLKSACFAAPVAQTMQEALDRWDEIEGQLGTLYDELNSGKANAGFAFEIDTVAAPLPRSFQYLDGACYLSHIRRNREARGDTLPEDILDAPLVYQGISHGFGAWNDPITGLNEADMIDFEAEIAAITGDVPMGIGAEEATRHIRLFCLLQDTSLRRIIPPELKRSFGFLTGKPASYLGPIAVTPDELGELWDGKMVGGTMQCTVRGKVIGEINTGIDSPFHYGHMIAHVAQTRAFEAGTIVGLGTVSNEDNKAGFGCIGEYRAQEIISTGSPTLDFLCKGDWIRIELLGPDGESVMGAVDQSVG